MERGDRASTITRLSSVRVGHAESADPPSGVTVLRFDRPTPTVVDVRGGASGTFDTASLALDTTFGRRLAIFFSGGSLYGLDAARGIRSALLADGDGVRVFGNPNRLVPISGAILFDLPSRQGGLADYERLGRRAARAASRAPVSPGRRGAGRGASIAKYLGRVRSAPGGIGSASADLGPLGWAGALAAVNSVGAIRDPDNGEWIAGPMDAHGRIVPPGRRGATSVRDADMRGTTLVAVVVEARLERGPLQRLAVAAHDGLARTIVPCHTATDGDVVFASSTETRPFPRRAENRPGAVVDRFSVAIADLVSRSVIAAARASAVRRGPRASARASRGGRGSGRSS